MGAKGVGRFAVLGDILAEEGGQVQCTSESTSCL
ncbi:protein of unknown function [Candidatus Promineifilum breve]|uniref:Uncharacterized protein n=1 Tax=Candidatus Promineifilum breve TaxID=1806508 RepID=A0A170PHY4_9CHLR|nr:protein of unknown function [Candidatus Promineifilum breve]